ncbi:MAG: NAD(+) synthase [Kiritimatiellia bacterium]
MTPNLRVAIAQCEVIPGQPAQNTTAICRLLAKARQQGAQIIVFPEMAVPGYLIGDRWEQPAFLRACQQAGEEIRENTPDICAIFGNVAIDWNKSNEDGRPRKYNALFIAENRTFLSPDNSPVPFVSKTLMPNYRQFDDSRHFFDLRKLAAEQQKPLEAFHAPIRTQHAVLGCLLCEDAWCQDYPHAPLGNLARHPEIQLVINASASPFTLNKNHKRNRVFTEHARHLNRPLLYVNHTGVQNNGKTIYTFDGSSCIYDGQGGRIDIAEPFEEKLHLQDIPLTPGSAFAAQHPLREDSNTNIAKALLYGLDKMTQATGIRKVVVGASGGIDSAVVAALFCHVLAPENVLLANMPSQFNSATTKGFAQTLAENLETPYVSVPIEASVNLTKRQIQDLQPTIRNQPAGPILALSDFMLENVQARDRSARILAALASAWGGAFTCNANKSEMTVGYTTLYGDLGGWIAPIADLWKGQVYALARTLNEQFFSQPVIPEGMFTLKPSAELSTNHNVDKGLGDPINYPYHDRLFASWVESWNRATPEENLTWYAAGELEAQLGLAEPINTIFPDAAAFIADLERWWNLYQGIGVAKRIQAPPVIAVTRRAFGFDHRESQIPPFFSPNYLALKKKLLAP